MPPNLPPACSIGEHDLGGRHRRILGVWMGSTGMPRPSSIDLAAAVGQQGDVDAAAVAGHGLVDGVVDDLVDQVVQTARGRWSRCTCRGACGRPRGPRGPGCPWRRRSRSLPLPRRGPFRGGFDGPGESTARRPGTPKAQVSGPNRDRASLPAGCDALAIPAGSRARRPSRARRWTRIGEPLTASTGTAGLGRAGAAARPPGTAAGWPSRVVARPPRACPVAERHAAGLWPRPRSSPTTSAQASKTAVDRGHAAGPPGCAAAGRAPSPEAGGRRSPVMGCTRSVTPSSG